VHLTKWGAAPRTSLPLLQPLQALPLGHPRRVSVASHGLSAERPASQLGTGASKPGPGVHTGTLGAYF